MKADDARFREYLKGLGETAGIGLTDTQLDLFSRFSTELMDWNRKINLTAITDPRAVAEKHLMDSLIPSRWIPETAEILDIGTGGGFPGIPLKILLPGASLLLVDGTRKKIAFLQYVIRALKLTGVTALQARIEDPSLIAAHGGGFDVVISRAFTALDRFFTLAAPFVRPGGRMLAMKGAEVETELATLNHREGFVVYGGRGFRLETHVYRLPATKSRRAVVTAVFDG